MVSALSALFPPTPTFTDKNLSSLDGKVYIITGAASGVGFELAKILYSNGGTVYVAARSTSRCNVAIQKIKATTNMQIKGGKLESMILDLADLSTIKPAAEGFLGKEERLDVLVHNAGVMTPPKGSRTKAGHDLEMSTNCLAPRLLTLFLEPILRKTAAASPKFSVRVVWVVSLIQFGAPPGGMLFDANGTPKVLDKAMDNYMQSKVGGAWLANEFAERLGESGVMSVSLHPGLMRTELQRNMVFIGRWIMSLVFKPPIYGAYSELYASFSPDLKEEHNGGYVIAWGRIANLPEGIMKGMKNKADGGTGAAGRFVEYCERETRGFL